MAAGGGGGAAAAAPAEAKTNAGMYMKNTMFTMISVTLAMSAAKWISGQEDHVPCQVNVNDNAWYGNRYHSMRIFNPRDSIHQTQYVKMRDGIELAVDTYAAKYIWEQSYKVPTVVSYTRHGRGYQVDFPFNLFTQYEKKFVNPRTKAYVERFVSSGYIWVSVDVRGTGASAGTKKHDFADQEIEDGYDVIEWITQQPWSDGTVASVGHGFEGVGALMLAASGHPALKAISLNGAPIDVFSSAFFPGGVKNLKALHDYSSFTHDTDRQIRWREVPELKARMMMNYFGGNVYRVDDDDMKFQQYIKAHEKNPVLEDELADVRFRDDKLKTAGITANDLTLFRQLGKIASSGVAIHAFGGYYDMGVARSTILLFQYLTNTVDPDVAALLPPLPEGVNTDPSHHRLSLGPWSHAGIDNADPFAQSKQKCFWHLDEISRFFDHHMYPNRRPLSKVEEEEPIHYFTIVHNRWKTSSKWPPAYMGENTFYLGLNETMSEVNSPEGEATKNITFKSLYDVQSRWDMIGHMFGKRPYYYHDRAPMADQYITFLTPELPIQEITGEVVLRAYISVDKPDVNLVAVLEDVDYQPIFKNENKRRGVTYITEALINPIHKTVRPDSSVHSFLKKDSRKIEAGKIYEVVFKFEPISYVVKQNHQLRLSIGAATPTVFAPAGPNEATKITVHFGGDYPSSLTLPSYAGVYQANIVPAEDAQAIPFGQERIGVPKQEEEAATADVVEEDEFAEEETTEAAATETKPADKEEL